MSNTYFTSFNGIGTPPQVLTSVCAAVANLSENEADRVRVMQGGGLTALLAMAVHADREVPWVPGTRPLRQPLPGATLTTTLGPMRDGTGLAESDLAGNLADLMPI